MREYCAVGAVTEELRRRDGHLWRHFADVTMKYDDGTHTTIRAYGNEPASVIETIDRAAQDKRGFRREREPLGYRIMPLPVSVINRVTGKKVGRVKRAAGRDAYVFMCEVSDNAR